MSKSAFYLAVLSLLSCHRTSTGEAPNERGDRARKGGISSPGGSRKVDSLTGPAAGASFGHSSTDTTWSEGLRVGANGPIPLIVVDQFGYRTQSVKVAVVRDPRVGFDSPVDFTPGSRYAVVSKVTGATVKVGAPVAWNGGATDKSSGDGVWWFDFSDVTTPGTYIVVDLERSARSVEFAIDDDVYRGVLKHAVRTYYYQRAGFEKSAETAGREWTDGASHLANGQDPESHAWQAKADTAAIKDLRGGWFDAGDYNKYTNWTARNVIVLLRAYEESPSGFGDDFGIAESGNGVPDLLDEVKWALGWLLRMQEADGSLLCVQGLASGSPPSTAIGPSFYGPATTSASLMGAAAFAYASKVYSAQPETELKALAAILQRQAERAWTWSNANPNVVYYNNDDSRQPRSGGLAAGQQETDDPGRLFAKFEAAVYLYERTGDATYAAFAESNFASILASTAPNPWQTDRQEALLYYSSLPSIPPRVKSEIVSRFVTNVTNNADQLPLVTGNIDPYRAPIKDYVWGSNLPKATQARLYQLLAKYHDDPTTVARASVAAEGYVHYLHGVNPLGLVYLTNMKLAGAEHSARTMFHNWFTDGSAKWDETSQTAPGPAPGFLVGGPNSGFSLDSCCTAAIWTRAYHCHMSAMFDLCKKDYSPPQGQPDQKSYLQFNSGWPAGSWSVTEPSTGYQAQYVRVLAAFVGK